MTLWRVEWLRLVRTGRLWIIFGVWALFGVLGPLSARYLSEIIERFGGDVQVQVAEPVPVDGMGQFLANAGQLGVLAVIAVAAGALCFDAKPDWSAFLRTRTGSTRPLVLPRVVWSTIGAIAGLLAGTLLAATLTAILIGTPDVADVALGTALSCLYLAFVVAVVALAASFVRQAITTVLLAVGALLVLPILQLISPIEPWLPSKLLGAIPALMGDTPATDLFKAAAVTLVIVPALLAWTIVRLDRREL